MAIEQWTDYANFPSVHNWTDFILEVVNGTMSANSQLRIESLNLLEKFMNQRLPNRLSPRLSAVVRSLEQSPFEEARAAAKILLSGRTPKQ